MERCFRFKDIEDLVQFMETLSHNKVQCPSRITIRKSPRGLKLVISVSQPPADTSWAIPFVEREIVRFSSLSHRIICGRLELCKKKFDLRSVMGREETSVFALDCLLLCTEEEWVTWQSTQIGLWMDWSNETLERDSRKTLGNAVRARLFLRDTVNHEK